MDGRHVTGSRLRLLRLQAGLKTSELAQLVKIGEGHLRNIEGERKGSQPSAVVAYRLAKELTKALEREITLDDFSYETVVQDAA